VGGFDGAGLQPNALIAQPFALAHACAAAANAIHASAKRLPHYRGGRCWWGCEPFERCHVIDDVAVVADRHAAIYPDNAHAPRVSRQVDGLKRHRLRLRRCQGFAQGGDGGVRSLNRARLVAVIAYQERI
jgi:hypothetical protein